jgi:hypothetical protein
MTFSIPLNAEDCKWHSTGARLIGEISDLDKMRESGQELRLEDRVTL